jgi:hypothetical protein
MVHSPADAPADTKIFVFRSNDCSHVEIRLAALTHFKPPLSLTSKAFSVTSMMWSIATYVRKSNNLAAKT